MTKMDQPKTIHQLTTDLAAKKISVTEVVADYLTKIAKRNGELNAFLTVAAAQAKAKAKVVAKPAAPVVENMPKAAKSVAKKAPVKKTN